MPATQVRGGQVKDASIQRVDVDTSTVGQALIRKLVQSADNSIVLSSTGADSGTGDVTVSLGTVIYIGTKARFTALANGLRLEIQDAGLNWIIQNEWTE